MLVTRGAKLSNPYNGIWRETEVGSVQFRPQLRDLFDTFELDYLELFGEFGFQNQQVLVNDNRKVGLGAKERLEFEVNLVFVVYKRNAMLPGNLPDMYRVQPRKPRVDDGSTPVLANIGECFDFP